MQSVLSSPVRAGDRVHVLGTGETGTVRTVLDRTYLAVAIDSRWVEDGAPVLRIDPPEVRTIGRAGVRPVLSGHVPSWEEAPCE